MAGFVGGTAATTLRGLALAAGPDGPIVVDQWRISAEYSSP